MEAKREKGKKNLILSTWERCKSIGHGPRSSSAGLLRPILTAKSKSWPRTDATLEEDKPEGKRRVAPAGCFSVYVGQERQRFVIKTEYVNHPLFKMLLEEAASEYGYSSQGPISLPCNVDTFLKVLSEMERDDDRPGCNGSR